MSFVERLFHFLERFHCACIWNSMYVHVHIHVLNTTVIIVIHVSTCTCTLYLVGSVLLLLNTLFLMSWIVLSQSLICDTSLKQKTLLYNVQYMNNVHVHVQYTMYCTCTVHVYNCRTF